ncbi:MAG: hypothetical protein AB1505_17245 [Candidatus Latescibacterota bacterium]
MDRHAELLEYWRRREAWLEGLYRAKLECVREWHEAHAARIRQRADVLDAGAGRAPAATTSPPGASPPRPTGSWWRRSCSSPAT